MTTAQIVAQGIGIFAMLLSFVLYQQTSHMKMLLVKLGSDLLWATHFLLIGGYSGMAISLVAAVRGIAFLPLDKRDSRHYLWVLFLFCGIGAASVALSWEGVWSVTSLVCTLLSTVAYWVKDMKKVKLMLLVVCISQLLYAVYHRTPSVILNQCIMLISLTLALLRLFVCGRRQKGAVKEEKTP